MAHGPQFANPWYYGRLKRENAREEWSGNGQDGPVLQKVPKLADHTSLSPQLPQVQLPFGVSDL